MTFLPPQLVPFQDEALKLIKNGAIRAFEFAGRTYQVNVYDPKTEENYWSFLHLTENGQIADSFCLCSEENESDWCVHLAASLLQIYNGDNNPLHVRYEACFWRALFFQIDKRFASKRDVLKTAKEFQIEAKNREGELYILELMQKSVPPTEETSLKFSDLSEKELEDIRAGHMTPKLHYEFSFWSDLAKTLLLIQENSGYYKITFSGNPPLKLEIDTELFHITYHLKMEELIEIIPKLRTVKSNLAIKGGFKDRVEEILFDPSKKELQLKASTFDIKGIEGKEYGGWIYKEGDGFYKKEAVFKRTVAESDISSFLNAYAEKIKSKKSNFFISDQRKEIRPHLEFNKENDLIISHFLNTPHDLDEALYFGDWVWTRQEGFFSIFKPADLLEEQVIPDAEVYDFVMTHQPEMNAISGFKVHLKAIESALTYRFNAKGSLVFVNQLSGIGKNVKEFGALIYIPEEGFFLKSRSESITSLKSGIEVPPHFISLFIKKNESELKLIPNFFMKKNPFHNVSITALFRNGEIKTVPEYDVDDEFRKISYRFYGDYVYFDGQGFFHLSEKHFLPEDYRVPRIIPKGEYGSFFYETIEQLSHFNLILDDQLKFPKKYEVYCKSLVWDEKNLKYQSDFFFNGISLSLLKNTKDRFYITEKGVIDLESPHITSIFSQFEGDPGLITSLELFKLLAVIDIEPSESAKPVLEEFITFKTPAPINLSGLKSELRPYQKMGVDWLWFLYTHKLSGLLCDDMGLGKTHQAMALMAGIKNDKPNARFLVVCPTSVLHHWEEKLKRFFPKLSVSVFHGLNRSLKDTDVILTSYGILRNEISLFQKINFDASIFDEIQIAKNHLSRVYQCLKEVRASFKLGLTGTPLENHLRELKSLFDIVLPGLMPSDADYLRLFIKPIEKAENKSAKSLLQRYVRPFLLRRTKTEVLTDLPEKIEEISHADLSPQQRKIYNDLYKEAKEGVIRDLMDEKKIIPFIHIFALLSSFKKICNHPALYLKDVANYKKYHSGKFDLFVELLNEAINSDQKVVVFSHFLGMLDIIEAYLTEHGIGFAALRGSTTNRREVIERFQKDPECRVFVASLQAGGLGIDLTGASVVIHYDRWWNAARENQATDRVHRIGQTRGVQVFKLVTLDTVEERIHQMIERKQRRMEEIVGQDEAQLLKTLTREELMELLRL